MPRHEITLEKSHLGWKAKCSCGRFTLKAWTSYKRAKRLGNDHLRGEHTRALQTVNFINLGKGARRKRASLQREAEVTPRRKAPRIPGPVQNIVAANNSRIRAETPAERRARVLSELRKRLGPPSKYDDPT
jgi:hypothetical protein